MSEFKLYDAADIDKIASEVTDAGFTFDVFYVTEADHLFCISEKDKKIADLQNKLALSKAKLVKAVEIVEHIVKANYKVTDYGKYYLSHNVVEELYTDKELYVWAKEQLAILNSITLDSLNAEKGAENK